MLDGDQVTNSLSWLRVEDSGSTRVVRNYLSSGSIDHAQGTLGFYNNTLTNFGIQHGLWGGTFTAQDNIFSGDGDSLGFKTQGGTATVTGNTFKNLAVGGQATATLTFADNYLFSNTIGFQSQGTNNVYDNVFSANTEVGYQNKNGSLTFTGNRLVNNGSGNESWPICTPPDAGLRFISSSASVANNTFENSTGLGIGVSDQTSGQTVSIVNNTIENNTFGGLNIGMFDGDSARSLDGDITTEWKTDPNESPHAHWIYYDRGSSETITKVQIYDDSFEVLTWNVYVSDDPDDWGTAVVSGWSVGGDESPPSENQIVWYESPGFSKSGRYIKLESTGGADNRISGDFFELEYQVSGDSTWYQSDCTHSSYVCSYPQNNLGTFVVENNLIDLNDRSGIAFAETDDMTIQNNIIVSNGLDDAVVFGLHHASGIQGRNGNFSLVSDNTIRNNLFAGISSYNVDGFIGPDNTLQNNGSAVGGTFCGILEEVQHGARAASTDVRQFRNYIEIFF